MLFTNVPAIVEAERARVYTTDDLADEMMVLFIDEGETRAEERRELVRPTTSARTRGAGREAAGGES